MDHSNDYIRLCTRAGEVQALWFGRHGDFYATGDGRIECLVEGCFPFGQIKQGYAVRYEKGALIRIAKCIWLPKLDQLMEMAQTKGRRFEKTAQDFFDWHKRPYGNRGKSPGKIFTTLEQLWLGYLMQVKFDKFWCDERWMKSSA